VSNFYHPTTTMIQLAMNEGKMSKSNNLK